MPCLSFFLPFFKINGIRPIEGLKLAILGAAVIRYKGMTYTDAVIGFLLMQASNLCFAGGQVAYKHVKRSIPKKKDHEIFAILYLGGIIVSSISATLTGNWQSLAGIDLTQAAVIIYLMGSWALPRQMT